MQIKLIGASVAHKQQQCCRFWKAAIEILLSVFTTFLLIIFRKGLLHSPTGLMSVFIICKLFYFWLSDFVSAAYTLS